MYTHWSGLFQENKETAVSLFSVFRDLQWLSSVGRLSFCVFLALKTSSQQLSWGCGLWGVVAPVNTRSRWLSQLQLLWTLQVVANGRVVKQRQGSPATVDSAKRTLKHCSSNSHNGGSRGWLTPTGAAEDHRGRETTSGIHNNADICYCSQFLLTLPVIAHS